LEALVTHRLDDSRDGLHREVVKCGSVHTRRHVSRYGLDFLIRDDVQVFLVHHPVEIRIGPIRVLVALL
jgi:hypothetical protein